MLERVAHFTILAKLGQGGMGVVFKAQDTKLRRAVALKLLPPADVADPERRARFVREARAAASVTHPNIATIYEIGEDEAGRVFIAMELADGVSLRQKLSAEGPCSVADASRLMREITRGLAKAHEAGLVHRDLKPDNIMVGPDGAVKILDFGLAKMRELDDPNLLAVAATGEHETAPITRAGVIVGTPAYMSPEQAMGKPVDARTDVFALGVVLFEMLTGQLPFAGSTAGELIVAVVRDEPRNLRELAAHVPERLAAVIAACLAKSPEERPKDAHALQERLAEPVGDNSDIAFAKTEPGIPTHPPPPVPPKPRRRLWPILLPILALGVAGEIAVLTRRPTEPVAALTADAGVRLLDLPPPADCSTAAQIEYRAGLEASRGRGMEYGRPHFEAAIKADSQCAEAYLRAALYAQPGAREPFQHAALLRDRLGDRDRDLLDAFAPVLTQEPPNHDEAIKRLRALGEKRPRDAEIIIFIGYWLWGHDPKNEMEAYGRRAVAIDPGFTAAWQLVGAARIKAGDNEGALQAFEECDRTIPVSIDCVYEETRLAQATGRCAAMETHARTLSTRLPAGDKGAYPLLARALAANDAPREAVTEALRQGATETTPARVVRGKMEQARLALAYGDFDAAQAILADVEKAIAGSDHLSQHTAATQLAFDLNLELGRTDAAIAVAEAFDRKQRAWNGAVTEVYGTGEEGILLVPRMLGLELAAGMISAQRRDSELAAWLDRRETIGDARARWLARYAATARTTKDAEEAVAGMPRSDASTPTMGLPSALAGQILIRGGRREEGIAELRRFTRRCERLEAPIAQTRAYLWLAEALEAAGRPAEACTEYGVVRARWPDARATSSRRAAERMRALSCVTAPSAETGSAATTARP